MYSYQTDRDETLIRLAGEGMALATVRRLFSLSQTAHRLAVAACNGDWPCDNGQRAVIYCPACEGGYVASSYRRAPGHAGPVCPDCRTTALITALLAGTGFVPVFQGDPRGCVVKVRVPSGYTNDSGREGVCIPVRER